MHMAYLPSRHARARAARTRLHHGSRQVLYPHFLVAGTVTCKRVAPLLLAGANEDAEGVFVIVVATLVQVAVVALDLGAIQPDHLSVAAKGLGVGQGMEWERHIRYTRMYTNNVTLGVYSVNTRCIPA